MEVCKKNVCSAHVLVQFDFSVYMFMTWCKSTSLCFEWLLIKESLTEVDPKLSTPQGYPLEVCHFNFVRDCEQQAPLPSELAVPPHMSVSVLGVLALNIRGSLPALVTCNNGLTSNGKGNTSSGFSLGSWLLMPAIRKASGALPSYVKFLQVKLRMSISAS